jgi:hypothetical protein
MKRALAALLLASCVPADHALPLGSLEFDVKGSHTTNEGLPTTFFAPFDEWTVHVKRVLLAFKTVTIGETNNPDKCSYRGRGAISDVVFDPRYGNTQIFNGLEASDCPDVGFVMQSPDGNTVPGAGATGADVVMLAEGNPAHAYVELTAEKDAQVYEVKLRFDTLKTPSRFGGCTAAEKGVRVVAEKRTTSSIEFAVDAFFRETLDANAVLRFGPFAGADANHDKVITMDELDAITLEQARTLANNATIDPNEPGSAPRNPSDGYHPAPGSTITLFGDFVRAQMKFAFFFDVYGSCIGDDPGTNQDNP